jgi:hypothetical protein
MLWHSASVINSCVVMKTQTTWTFVYIKCGSMIQLRLFIMIFKHTCQIKVLASEVSKRRTSAEVLNNNYIKEICEKISWPATKRHFDFSVRWRKIERQPGDFVSDWNLEEEKPGGLFGEKFKCLENCPREAAPLRKLFTHALIQNLPSLKVHKPWKIPFFCRNERHIIEFNMTTYWTLLLGHERRELTVDEILKPFFIYQAPGRKEENRTCSAWLHIWKRKLNL